MTLLAIIVAGQLWLFYDRFMQFQRVSFSQNPSLPIAEAARDASDPKAALISIDGDWSSAIPHYPVAGG